MHNSHQGYARRTSSWTARYVCVWRCLTLKTELEAALSLNAFDVFDIVVWIN